MTQTPNPPAGWYPQGGQERWWDGTAWSDNFRPLNSEPAQPQPTAVYPATVQPTYQQSGYQQPPYGQPVPGQPGQPGYYAAPAPKQSHVARNILIVFAVLFLLFVGGCVAAVVVLGDKVDDAVNDDTLGGPNNPLTITEGEAFEVAGFEYAGGWQVTADASGFFDVVDLKLTNDRDEADRLLVEIKLLNGGEVLATATCGNLENVAEDTTVTVDCTSSDTLPAAYDRITIQDAF